MEDRMTDTTPHLLLVDDDHGLSELLSEYLTSNGCRVEVAYSGEEALEKFRGAVCFNLVVLDIMMPGISGLEVLPAIRAHSSVPVIMLTGRGDDIDRILGLEMGADDYLAKPCNPRELLARIKAVLRRSGSQPIQPKQIQKQGITLDMGERTVLVHGEVLELTSTEFDVLGQLMKHAGEVVSKSDLTERVLHRKLMAYDRSIDVHVSRVRQQLRSKIPDCELIKTVRGVGYQFVN